jgi:hypothetical protein
MSIKHKVVGVLGVSVVITCSAATARELSKDVSKLTPDASEVISATVVLTPPGLMTRAPLTEKQMLGFGCNFTQERESISALVDVIKNNLQGDNSQAGRFYLRNAIYLKLKNGTVIRYTFSDATNRDQQIYGGADYGGAGDSSIFMAQRSFLEDLQRWLPHKSVERKDGKWCVDKNA